MLVTSSQFLYTNEKVLHKGTEFYECSYTLQMSKYGTQLAQQMSEMS